MHKQLLKITLVTSLFFFLGCEEKVIKKSTPPPPLKINSINVQKDKFPIWVQYTGKTKASSQQEVRARISGRLEKIFFKDGQIVKKGDPLFLIEQAQYKAALNAAKATKARDEATLKLTIADVARYKPLVNEGLAPRATLEQYEARFHELTAQIQADNAKIEDAKLKLSYTQIKAPISGKVSARLVDVGNLVGYGESTLLTTILQTNPLYAYFAPAEKDVQIIQKYRSKDILNAFIEVRSSNENIIKTKHLKGSIDFSDNTVDPMTSTVTMRAKIDNSTHSILPGTFVYVNVFITDKIDFILIPPQTILEDQLGKYVYTIKDNKAKRTAVKTGYTSRYYIAVDEGLEVGDKLIVNGFMKVRDGREVISTDVTKTEGIEAILKKNHLIPSKS
jgi:RND family efflux transporter MFP subunit